MRSNVFVAAALTDMPLAVLALTIPDPGSLSPQILITLDTDEQPWRLTIPTGKIDFMASDRVTGYSVRNATLTDISSHNGTAVSLAFTAYFEGISEFPA